MKYKVGRSNLALTVFVPWDCENNCEFCTSKENYCNKRNVSECIDKIKVQIDKYISLGIQEVVFTGGEPLASPCLLLDLLRYTRNVSDEYVQIYINTSLPNINYDRINQEAYNELTRNHQFVDCFNISRHKETYNDDCNFFCGAIYDDSEIEKIVPKVRINTVYNCLDLTQYFERWSKVKKNNIELSMRADYRFINESNLKSYDEEGFQFLSQYPDMEFINSSGCTVCNNDDFILHTSFAKQRIKELVISYHRGLESSARLIGNTMFINDVIVNNEGMVSFDWDNLDWSEVNTDNHEPINDIDKAIIQYYLHQSSNNILSSDNSKHKTISSSSFGGCGGGGSTC